MIERPEPTLTGKELLLAQGLPYYFIEDFNEKGLAPHYLDYYEATGEEILRKYPPTKLSILISAQANRNIRTLLRQTPTYTEYLGEKITKYNDQASTDRLPLIEDTEQTITSLLAIPGGETCDAIARTLRRSARNSILTSHNLVIQFGTLTAEISGVMYGPEERKRMLTHFGLTE